jgi:hypothetical protein
MKNLLLEAYRRADGDDCYDGTYSLGWGNYRKALCRQYAWAVPNDEAIRALVALGPIIEIGAGTGYWAALVNQAGGDVVAYDIKPHDNHWCRGNHMPICTGGPEVAQAHPHRALMLCWPPCAESMGCDALLAYEGDTLIYIGEGNYGCTGDEEMHALMGALYQEVKKVEIPRWRGMYDSLTIWHRK